MFLRQYWTINVMAKLTNNSNVTNPRTSAKVHRRPRETGAKTNTQTKSTNNKRATQGDTLCGNVGQASPKPIEVFNHMKNLSGIECRRYIESLDPKLRGIAITIVSDSLALARSLKPETYHLMDNVMSMHIHYIPGFCSTEPEHNNYMNNNNNNNNAEPVLSLSKGDDNFDESDNETKSESKTSNVAPNEVQNNINLPTKVTPPPSDESSLSTNQNSIKSDPFPVTTPRIQNKKTRNQRRKKMESANLTIVSDNLTSPPQGSETASMQDSSNATSIATTISPARPDDSTITPAADLFLTPTFQVQNSDVVDLIAEVQTWVVNHPLTQLNSVTGQVHLFPEYYSSQDAFVCVSNESTWFTKFLVHNYGIYTGKYLVHQQHFSLEDILKSRKKYIVTRILNGIYFFRAAARPHTILPSMYSYLSSVYLKKLNWFWRSVRSESCEIFKEIYYYRSTALDSKQMQYVSYAAVNHDVHTAIYSDPFCKLFMMNLPFEYSKIAENTKRAVFDLSCNRSREFALTQYFNSGLMKTMKELQEKTFYFLTPGVLCKIAGLLGVSLMVVTKRNPRVGGFMLIGTLTFGGIASGIWRYLLKFLPFVKYDPKPFIESCSLGSTFEHDPNVSFIKHNVLSIPCRANFDDKGLLDDLNNGQTQTFRAPIKMGASCLDSLNYNYISPKEYYKLPFGFWVPFSKPNNNPNSLLSGLTRVLHRPLKPNDSLIQNLFTFCTPYLPSISADFAHLTYAEILSWVDSRDKKKEYLSALTRLERNADYGVAMQTKVKTDELLFYNKSRVRMIMVPGPEMVVKTAPYIERIFTQCKEYWRNTSFKIGDKCYYLHCGSGLTTAELSEWFTVANAGTIGETYIIAAGDDMLAIEHVEGGTKYYESDFSAFDQSQHQLLNLFLMILPREIAVLVRGIYTSNLKVKVDKLAKFDILIDEDNYFLPSGVASTTPSNTMVCLYTWLYFFAGGFEDPLEYFRGLGLEIKLKMFTSYEFCTFLKGQFFRHSDGYVWAPLLGTLGKLGYSKRNLNQLPQLSGLNPGKQVEKFASDAVQVYQYYTWHPVYRAIYERWNKSFEYLADDVQVNYQLKASFVVFDESSLDLSPLNLYGSESEIKQLIRNIARCPDGASINSELILNASTRDYG